MQRTRWNTIVDNFSQTSQNFFNNPWRKNALNFISLLLGIFMGTAFITIYGQRGGIDLIGAFFLVLFTETISRLMYTRTFKERRVVWIQTLNIFKIGLTFGLFVEAFKLGS